MHTSRSLSQRITEIKPSGSRDDAQMQNTTGHGRHHSLLVEMLVDNYNHNNQYLFNNYIFRSNLCIV